MIKKSVANIFYFQLKKNLKKSFYHSFLNFCLILDLLIKKKKTLLNTKKLGKN